MSIVPLKYSSIFLIKYFIEIRKKYSNVENLNLIKNYHYNKILKTKKYNYKEKFIKLNYSYSLFHYSTWLKVGCKNISWKKYITVNFLIDTVFLTINNFSKDIKILKFSKKQTNSHITISKGILVRKKKSREQHKFRQDSFTIEILIKLKTSILYRLLLNNDINNFNNIYILSKIKFIKQNIKGVETNIFFLNKHIFSITTDIVLYIKIQKIKNKNYIKQQNINVIKLLAWVKKFSKKRFIKFQIFVKTSYLYRKSIKFRNNFKKLIRFYVNKVRYKRFYYLKKIVY